jgi:hypothetical protein
MNSTFFGDQIGKLKRNYTVAERALAALHKETYMNEIITEKFQQCIVAID